MNFDYKTLPNDKYPYLVWADHNYSPIASVIKGRTKSNYSHLMLMIDKGVLASQGFTTYKRVPIEEYLKPGNKLKFVGLEGITEKGRALLIESVEKKLKGPWWTKLYDWVGIIGQATGLRWIQNPLLTFCSEDPAYHLQKVELENPLEFNLALSGAIRGLPKNGSPGIHDEYSKAHRDVFKLYGKWEGDEKD